MGWTHRDDLSLSARLAPTAISRSSAWEREQSVPHEDIDRLSRSVSEYDRELVSDPNVPYTRAVALHRRNSSKDAVFPWAYTSECVDATRQGIDLALRVQAETKRQELLAAQ